MRRPLQRGGPETLDALFRDPELDCSGIAITFVAERRFHDTIHRRRSRGLPSTNSEDFEDGAPIARARLLEGETAPRGDGDDDCHDENGEAPANEPAHHDRSFDMQIEPNRTHGISAGAGTRRHLHTTMTDHVLGHLSAGAR